jgi:hypothetical protein
MHAEHCFSKQEGRMPSNTEVPEPLLPMKDKILELDYHSPPEINSQLCIPDTTQKWLVSCADSMNSLLSLMSVYLLYFCIGAIILAQRNIIMESSCSPRTRQKPQCQKPQPATAGKTIFTNYSIADGFEQ